MDDNTGIKIAITVLVIVVLFFFVAWLWPFVQVGAGERGVVMNLGKVQGYVLDEGFHFRTPIVQTVKVLSVRVQKNDIKAEAASKDLQTVTTDIVVNWHISPAKANVVYQQVGELQDVVDRIITPAVSEVVKASTAQKNAEEIITLRPQLKADIDKRLAERLTSYNIVLDDISIVNVDFSKEFNAAIEAKQVAEQEAKKAQFIADKAVKDAEAIVNAAKGQAEAQRVVQISLTPELLQKLAIERWNGALPVYVGANTPLPFLNLK